MLADMSSHLFSEWMAYYNLEPFGDELTDIHLARLAAYQVSSKKKQVTPEKMRLWKRISQPVAEFDPQDYFDGLKQAFGLKKE
jgi:hypothetical protein